MDFHGVFKTPGIITDNFLEYWIETRVIDDKIEVNVGDGRSGVFMSHTVDCGKPFRYLGFASWDAVMHYQIPGD